MLRALAFAIASVLTLVTPGLARTVTDSAGRTLTIPDAVHRVFAAGPPASTLLYALAPETMMGWTRPPREAEKPFLLPATRDLPQLGRLTGRGDTLNLEVLLAQRPDLIIDFGTISDTYRSLADRVQQQTGIPYLLVDGRFENTAAAIRLLSDVLGVPTRGAALAAFAEATFAQVDATLARVPAAQRPHVYLARGPEGLETGTRGSINTEILERVGATNVVEGLRATGGLATASPEQIIAWNPDTIVTLDRAFKDNVAQKANWRDIPAVVKGRVFLAPSLPFGFIDTPPSVNRLVGLPWLLQTLYPEQAKLDLRATVRDFYHLWYQVDVSDAQLDMLLAGSGG